MAVQQNKKSPSRRGMHRSHDHLTNPAVAVEPTTGETHLRHHVSPTGFYRAKQVDKTKGEKLRWSLSPSIAWGATTAPASRCPPRSSSSPAIPTWR